MAKNTIKHISAQIILAQEIHDNSVISSINHSSLNQAMAYNCISLIQHFYSLAVRSNVTAINRIPCRQKCYIGSKVLKWWHLHIFSASQKERINYLIFPWDGNRVFYFFFHLPSDATGELLKLKKSEARLYNSRYKKYT